MVGVSGVGWRSRALGLLSTSHRQGQPSSQNDERQKLSTRYDIEGNICR